jgi:hypothetical protein
MMPKVSINLIIIIVGILSSSCSDSNTRSFTPTPPPQPIEQCPYSIPYLESLGNMWLANLAQIRSIEMPGFLPNDLAERTGKQEEEIRKILSEIAGNSTCTTQSLLLKGVLLKASNQLLQNQ